MILAFLLLFGLVVLFLKLNTSKKAKKAEEVKAEEPTVEVKAEAPAEEKTAEEENK